MTHDEFSIGCEFISLGTNHKWRCTDIGTRTIQAICLDDHSDSSWFHGPPYAVAEIVFDEDSIDACIKV